VNTITGKFDRVFQILDKYEHDPNRLIAILQEMQAEYGYLPEEIMTFVATALKISPAAVYGVATFYSHFTLSPKGKHILRLCDGTACHVKRSEALLEALREELGLSAQKNTTDDGLFTLETVACLGACGLAPVLVADEAVHGLMTPEKALKLVRDIKRNEEGGAQ
jgi:NADH-quinone oxidoreductase subunit E